ncbi:MAG: hypothetical protein KF768_11115 [Phycisphaeraceae bacterium]|nr:hypothetical protein [Phycisphaeraceae bacterium]
MHRRWNLGALLAALVLSAGGVAKSDVVVRVNGGTPQSASSVIDVGTVTSTVLIHIYDDDVGVPDESLDNIVIRGTAGSGGKIHLLIADQALTGYPDADAPLVPISEGILNFGTAQDRGSITFLTSTDDPNDDLRDITEVAIAVLGEIHADISVGRVYRIQASTTSGGVGGFISGEITAHALSGPQKLASLPARSRLNNHPKSPTHIRYIR